MKKTKNTRIGAIPAAKVLELSEGWRGMRNHIPTNFLLDVQEVDALNVIVKRMYYK